ncbi:MAG: ATP-binding protein, partial [archaeon]|nr:ATP-binding protein [archaeon]
MNIIMEQLDIKNLKEGVDLEIKKCKDKLPRSFWETYSSFANTFGGTIVLGIDEKNNMDNTGVSDPDKVIQEIWDIVNN